MKPREFGPARHFVMVEDENGTRKRVEVTRLPGTIGIAGALLGSGKRAKPREAFPSEADTLVRPVPEKPVDRLP